MPRLVFASCHCCLTRRRGKGGKKGGSDFCILGVVSKLGNEEKKAKMKGREKARDVTCFLDEDSKSSQRRRKGEKRSNN